ncbi:MAG TPA: LptE family protein [bacterium]
MRRAAEGCRSALGLLSLLAAAGFAAGLAAGCGYTTRPGLPTPYQTIYVHPLVNRIDLTDLGGNLSRFPVYRHAMETELTDEILRRFQFTGLLRPSPRETADVRLEGELLQFRRDALRYSASGDVEEWRLSLVVSLRLIDRETGTTVWSEPGFVGDTTYFTTGPYAEAESGALARAITDLSRRIVERTVENW